jgi:hypothetical protein
MMTPESLRDGIFSINTRRFGTVAEVMIKRLVLLAKSKNQFHDLYDDVNQKRVEVKFSTVRKKNDMAITEASVLNCIYSEIGENRLFNFESWKDFKFDCNIQQIKKSEFEILYYGLFFYDRVLIFKINSCDITNENIWYSDKQHKGNVGEGQFHINEGTIQVHLDKYLVHNLSYSELLSLLT